MINKILTWRIWWTCKVEQGSDGYYYHKWTNCFINDEYTKFAGYTKHALNNKSTTFLLVLHDFIKS